MRTVCWVLVGVGVLTFFMPLVTVTAPIVGKVEWSSLNIVSGIFESKANEHPSFRKLAEHSSQDSASVSWGVRQVVGFPFAILGAYVFLVAVSTAQLANTSKSFKESLSIVGMVCSLYALVSLYVFSDAYQRELQASFRGDKGASLGAAFGQAMARSIRVDPGSGLYLLAVAMVLLFLVLRLEVFERLLTRQVVTPSPADPREPKV